MTCATLPYMPDIGTLVVLTGLPASGKSTLAERIRERDYPQALVLASDDIRATFGGLQYRSHTETHVREVQAAYTKGCLSHGRSVVIDSTNLSRWHRDTIRSWAYGINHKAVCYEIKLSTDESIRRSAKWISRDDILRLSERYEPVDLDQELFHRYVAIDGENDWKILTDWKR